MSDKLQFVVLWKEAPPARQRQTEVCRTLFEQAASHEDSCASGRNAAQTAACPRWPELELKDLPDRCQRVGGSK